MSPHYSPLVSALVSMILTLFLSLNKQGMIQEAPQASTLEAVSIPRNGGIALMAGMMSGWVLMFKSWAWWVVLPALGLFVWTLLAEARNLDPKSGLIVRVIAAASVIFGAGVPWLWLLPVLFGILWMTSLYGHMDDADGLTAGMALFGFSFYGAAGLMHGNEAFAMMCFSVGAAGLGFLYHNFHPARVFLGGTGTVPLGFLAAAFGVWGWRQEYWPIWFPVLVFSPFVVDAALTQLGRVRNQTKLTGAHRIHYYQRLVQMGWGHEKIAIAEYVLMVLAGVSALIGIGLDAHGQGNLLAYWGAIYLALNMWMDKRWGLYLAEHKEDKDVA